MSETDNNRLPAMAIKIGENAHGAMFSWFENGTDRLAWFVLDRGEWTYVSEVE